MDKKHGWPLISIITVVFRGRDILEETIKSAIDQRYNNTELVIIDGGSDDGTVDVIKKYQDCIDYWVSEKDDGIYDAMNKGVEAAKGELVFFLNAGDRFVDNKVLSDIADFYREKHIDMVYGNIIYQDPTTKISVRRGRELDIEDMKAGRMIPHQSIFMKRDVICELGGFDTKYKIAADFDLLCRFFKGAFLNAYLSREIAFYDGGGVSSNQIKSSREKKYIINNNFGMIHCLNFAIKRFFINSVMVIFDRLYLLNFYYQMKYKFRVTFFK